MAYTHASENEPSGASLPVRAGRWLGDHVHGAGVPIWRRQVLFLIAATLGAYHVDPVAAFLLYGVILLVEAIDMHLANRTDVAGDRDPRKARVTRTSIPVPAVTGALFLGALGFSIPLVRDSAVHLTTLALLFAAAIVADRAFAHLRRNRQRARRLEHLEEAHACLSAAHEMTTTFISTITHELRTPLTSIKGSLDLINAGALGEIPDRMAPMLSTAGKNAKRLAALIDDLLDLQKIEAGEMVYRFEPIPVGELIRDAVEANQGLADSLRVRLIDIPPTGALFIRGDVARLMQVMSNVIANAIGFSDEGSVVRVYSERVGRRVRICVQDSGIGIPAGARDKVFGKFTQVDNGDRRRVGGTGLGMNISRQIVERHKGDIDYVSHKGKGTTFFVAFDLLDAEPAAAV